MFVLRPKEENRRGTVSQFEIPSSDFYGTAFEQGFYVDNAFAAVSRLTDQHIARSGKLFLGLMDYDTGRRLSPDEANQKYGMEGLRFEEPTTEAEARLLNQRKRDELRRSFILGQGANTVSRFAGSLGTQLVSSMLNPIDFSLMFVPVVGAEERVRLLAQAGKGTARQILARGLVTEETLAKRVMFPRLTAAVIEGTVGQAVAEVPIAISKFSEQANYTLGDSALNVAAGGLFAGGIRLSLDFLGKVGRIWRGLEPGTKKQIFKTAINNFVEGKPQDNLHHIVHQDENFLRDGIELQGPPTPDRVVSPEIPAERYNERSVILMAMDELKRLETLGKETSHDFKILKNIVSDVLVGGENSFNNLDNIARLLGVRFDPLSSREISRLTFPEIARLSPRNRGRVLPTDQIKDFQASQAKEKARKAIELNQRRKQAIKDFARSFTPPRRIEPIVEFTPAVIKSREKHLFDQAKNGLGHDDTVLDTDINELKAAILATDPELDLDGPLKKISDGELKRSSIDIAVNCVINNLNA